MMVFFCIDIQHIISIFIEANTNRNVGKNTIYLAKKQIKLQLCS